MLGTAELHDARGPQLDRDLRLALAVTRLGVVHGQIDDHAAGDQLLLREAADEIELLLTAQLARDANRNGRAIRRRITEHPTLGLRLAPKA